VMNVTFALVIGVFFAILFGIEGAREVFKGNLIGIGGILFSLFLFVKIFVLSLSAGQTVMAFIASYCIAVGLQLLFKKRRRMNFWQD